MVKRLIQRWRKWRFPYTPLVEINISKERLLHNLRVFQNAESSPEIAPVLKSNAYGHGLTLIAKILDSEKLPFLIVDSYHEAMILRNEGIHSPILIIGYTLFENIQKCKLQNVAFAIAGIEQLEEISKNLSRPTDFHIKIDTGMRRQGVVIGEIEKAMGLIRANHSIHITGICSHLADADSKSKEITEQQIKVWNNQTGIWKKEFPTIKYFHLGATGSISYSNVAANVLRLGIGLYGIDPSEDSRIANLKPILEMKSIISGTKTVEPGDLIGYSGIFKAPDKMRIATIPAGYYEGVDRRLSNKGFVKISGKFCPIVGRISMNITTVDITKVPDAKLNTPVILISNNNEDGNSIQGIVKLTGALERELLVHIPQQLRRKVV